VRSLHENNLSGKKRIMWEVTSKDKTKADHLEGYNENLSEKTHLFHQ
jgi:hypothetical protein